MVARRAERSRRRRKVQDRARARRTSAFFQFTLRLLESKRSAGDLKAGKEDIKKYLMEMLSAPNRKEEQGEWKQLIRPEEPNQPLDELQP